jgi:hypothetical protein
LTALAAGWTSLYYSIVIGRKRKDALIRRKKLKRGLNLKSSYKHLSIKKSITVTDDYNKNELILNVQTFLRHEFIEKY